MKPHPKIRKTVKWTGAVVSIFLVLVAVASLWWKVWWGNGRQHYFSVDRGEVTLVFDPTTWAHDEAEYGYSLQQLPIAEREEAAARAVGTSDEVRWIRAVHQKALHELRVAQLRTGWGASRVPPGFRVWFDGDFRKGHWSVSIPFGVIASLGVAVSVVVWWSGFRVRGRVRAGRCHQCNYDRVGLPSEAACPECGEAPSVEVAASTISGALRSQPSQEEP